MFFFIAEFERAAKIKRSPFTSLALNRPGFLESSTAGGRIPLPPPPPPPCVSFIFEDQWPWNLVMSYYIKSSTKTVADPDRCHGFQETCENCPHKFNTLYKFCSWQKQQPRTWYFFRWGDNFVQIRVQETRCVEASCRGDWLFAYWNLLITDWRQSKLLTNDESLSFSCPLFSWPAV